MDYETDIKPLQDAGTTDPQAIADALKATGVTNDSIDRADLVHLLNMRGMLTKLIGNLVDEKWTGTILTMQDAINGAGTDEQKSGIALWLSHITNPTNKTWDTTQVEFAKPFWEMSQAFAGMAGMPTVEDFASIAALGGGWKFATTTGQNVIDEIAKHDREVALSQVTQWNNAADAAAIVAYDADKTPAEITQAARDAWGS